MFEMESIHHVSLSITNLERAKYFYGTILGFQEIKRPDFDFPGAWYQIGNQQLHLIVHPASDTLREGDIQTKDGHFAIRVKDYEKTLQYLKNKEIEIVEKPNSDSGFAQIFCMDPDRNLIELNVDQAMLRQKND
ncbi:glyoxalase [Alkalihalobacillus alcalophilus ATCC 27647 = CGMCC 1.3604]|uniref:Glyoxalase n=1 Tax=Alkalihalobacillus alcalophilus ATCC 27647 = CGMCC 1.3604 TaxID=1218173 RepID=A0A094YZ93_ALKAL|nr:VOC family protein [Alkalihalobacillus alcalophilus]KGA98872.1 glyoxalase [Alkalihalobacillus alcalophilus ATCC 27647 = CGMCC 1.3604]MED1560511.1 VOC family protein [Alkalihalobacillus alcalophilus]THG91793.1 glyoxalase [Alkalihalobacillus alcalophilus ATCC 27647 = CGMCC 1.3604]